MSTVLAEFKKRFDLDWTSLLAGWRGLGCHRRLVRPSEVREFAMEKLESETEQSADFARLAGVWDSEADDQLDALLAKLASHDHADYERAERKWAVCLLEKCLHDLPTDPLYGLLGLTEFWSDMGFPNYGPHQVQGVGNEMTPKDYYTAENYRSTLDHHRLWIENETRSLTSSRDLEADG